MPRLPKRKKTARKVSVYSNLVTKARTKRDTKAKKRAEYLATLPKNPWKRLAYRLHPKRVAAFWFSKRGAMTALKGLGIAILLVILLVGALFAYYRKDLAAIRPGEIDKRVQSTVTYYYDRNGVELWQDKGDGDYKLVIKEDQIPKHMKEATIAIEDRDFYSHRGVSFSGILRAMVSNTQGNSTQGGSTLTQQLVKQVFFADEAQQRGLAGIPRKIKEMILAIEVERMYKKDQIIALYLNESPYGGRRNGVESAAQTYFGKTAKDLTLAECAFLAAIPNQPGLYNPYNIQGNDALISRQHKVLDGMVEMKYITKEESDAAKKVAILDTLKPESDRYANIKAPHFISMVQRQLEQKLGKATVGQGGLHVTTTLDITVQEKLEANMSGLFSGELTDRNCNYINCSNYAGFTNGAAAVEDNQTGQVIALVGSRGYSYPGFGQDNAATAFIQPGSSIKPLVYAQLLQNQGEGRQNYGSGTVLADNPTTFPPASWKPQNADGKFKGNIDIRDALATSRNIPAIKAMAINEQNNKGSTWQVIREMGDKEYCTQGADAQAGLSSAIGGCGTKLIDHVNAMASFARMGAYVPQSTVLKVTNNAGQTLQEFKTTKPKQVIDPQAAYIINDILGDGNARAGLGWRQDYLPRSTGLGMRIAAKTGTSNGEIRGKIMPKDLWTVGYTPALSMAVWLGNPDTTPLTQGNSLIPAMVFDKTMAEASQYYFDTGKAKNSDWFDQPEGVQRIGNELYPAYYNRSSAQSNATMTFDKVSRKKATDCTPSAARIDIQVLKVTDPYTKRESISAPDGYDPNADDDTHTCSDTKPSISVSIHGREATISYTAGKFTLQSVEVRYGDTIIASRQVSTNDSWQVSLRDVTRGSQLTATVVDTGYYSTSDTKTY